jgi:Flp pilus assembly protein TadG
MMSVMPDRAAIPKSRPITFARADRGAAAVELALILPILIVLVYGIFAASWVLAVEHGLQQLASESARAALAGLDQSERDGLARAYVSAEAGTYAYLNPSALTVSTATSNQTLSFTVTTRYDLSSSPLYPFLSRFMPLASPIVSRAATIRQGGF